MACRRELREILFVNTDENAIEDIDSLHMYLFLYENFSSSSDHKIKGLCLPRISLFRLRWLPD